MATKPNNTPNQQIALLFLLVLVIAGLSAGEIYARRAWFHAGDHIGIAQAAAAIIFGAPTLLLSIGAVIAGIRAAKASEAQAAAAREQVSAAQAQSALAKAQLREAVRPVLSIRRGDFGENATLGSDLPRMQMHNVGLGTARNLIVGRFENTDFHRRTLTSKLPMLGTVLPPSQAMQVPSHPDEEEDSNENLMIFYESVSGDRYCSTFYADETEPILNYEDEPALWPE